MCYDTGDYEVSSTYIFVGYLLTWAFISPESWLWLNRNVWCPIPWLMYLYTSVLLFLHWYYCKKDKWCLKKGWVVPHVRGPSVKTLIFLKMQPLIASLNCNPYRSTRRLLLFSPAGHRPPCLDPPCPCLQPRAATAGPFFLFGARRAPCLLARSTRRVLKRLLFIL